MKKINLQIEGTPLQEQRKQFDNKKSYFSARKYYDLKNTIEKRNKNSKSIEKKNFDRIKLSIIQAIQKVKRLESINTNHLQTRIPHSSRPLKHIDHKKYQQFDTPEIYTKLNSPFSHYIHKRHESEHSNSNRQQTEYMCQIKLFSPHKRRFMTEPIPQQQSDIRYLSRYKRRITKLSQDEYKSQLNQAQQIHRQQFVKPPIFMPRMKKIHVSFKKSENLQRQQESGKMPIWKIFPYVCEKIPIKQLAQH